MFSALPQCADRDTKWTFSVDTFTLTKSTYWKNSNVLATRPKVHNSILRLTSMYTENYYIQSQYCCWGKVYITFCLYWFTFIMSDIKYMNFKQYRITSKLKFQNSYFCQTFCNKATFFFKLSAILNRFNSEQDSKSVKVSSTC